jgi:hypothetical protein
LRDPRFFVPFAIGPDATLALRRTQADFINIMVTKRVSWYKRFKFESCHLGLPVPCELQRQRGRPTAGKRTRKMSLIARASQRAIAPVWRNQMKRFCLGVVVAASLTLPAFGQSALKEQLAGIWTLASCNGANAPYCAGNNGILFLDANGRYTVTIAARGRPKVDLATHGHDGLSAEEYKTSAIGLVTNNLGDPPALPGWQ